MKQLHNTHTHKMPKKGSSKKKNRKPKIRRGWSHLPPELLQIIASYLIDITDYVRFRAVCNPWRSALASFTLHQQIPWLLLSSDNPTTVSRRLFSLSSDEVFTLNLPQTLGKSIFGTSSGLLLISQSSQSISLFNPHSKSVTELPPLNQMKQKELYKGSLISLSSSSYIVMVAFRLSSTLVFCRSGDTRWTKIYASRHSTVVDFTYHKNKFFILESTGRFSIVDDITLDRMSFNEPSSLGLRNSSCRYLVNLASGELALVVREGTWFKVFRITLDGDGNLLTWLRLRNVGNNMLFVDDHHAMSLDARKFPEFEGNHIYFVGPKNSVGWRDFLFPEENRTSQGGGCGDLYCIYSFYNLYGRLRKHSCCWIKYPEERTKVAWFLPSL